LSHHFPDGGVRVERAAVYTFHGLIAEQWRGGRHGRVMLAGDAAHQMPPFLGQGMCSGVRDAVNLAWKLRSVIDGADASLLDTYQAERSPHVRTIVEAAVGFGRVICTLDPDVAAARNEGMLAARAAGSADTGGSPMPMLGASDALVDGAGFVSTDGTHGGSTLDAIQGNRWMILAEPHVEVADDVVSRLDAVVVRVDDAVDDAIDDLTNDASRRQLKRCDSDVVIVRPDRIVFGWGSEGLAALDEFVRRYFVD
jgi:3-(3-hydroxy-phenyl)propionate hydroxylase